MCSGLSHSTTIITHIFRTIESVGNCFWSIGMFGVSFVGQRHPLRRLLNDVFCTNSHNFLSLQIFFNNNEVFSTGVEKTLIHQWFCGRQWHSNSLPISYISLISNAFNRIELNWVELSSSYIIKIILLLNIIITIKILLKPILLQTHYIYRTKIALQ